MSDRANIYVDWHLLADALMLPDGVTEVEAVHVDPATRTLVLTVRADLPPGCYVEPGDPLPVIEPVYETVRLKQSKVLRGDGRVVSALWHTRGARRHDGGER